MELDHLIAFTRPGAPIVDRLVDAGFRAGTSNSHAAQGTANRRVFFANAYLEFLFCTDPGALESELVAPTGLGARFRGGCPLGVVLRDAGGADLPFQTWKYRAAYLPTGAYLLMSESSGIPEEPLVVVVPDPPPGGSSSRPAQPLEHPAGPRRISQVELAGPWPVPGSAALAALSTVPGVTVASAPEYHLSVALHPRRGGHFLDLRPDATMSLSW